MLQHAFICMGRMGGELSTQEAEAFKVPQYACLEACPTVGHQMLLSRYFDQPAKVKAGFPTTDWGTLDLLGYKAYRMQEGGMKIIACVALILLQIFHYDA